MNAIVPPAANHPVITIRRFVRKVFTTDDLVADNFLTAEMVPFLQTLVRGKANMVVCGATGCGKTTFLRWLAGFVPPEERIITIEDTRELNLDHPHCISLEATDKAGIYELMINALRMRPDRIILGEVRGAEALELLQAMGTGHEGSLTTVHANYGKHEAVHQVLPLKQALENFAARCNYPPVSSFVSVVLFGITTGTNVDHILDSFSRRAYEARV